MNKILLEMLFRGLMGYILLAVSIWIAILILDAACGWMWRHYQAFLARHKRRTDGKSAQSNQWLS